MTKMLKSRWFMWTVQKEEQLISTVFSSRTASIFSGVFCLFLTLFFKQVSALTVVAAAKSCVFSSISLSLEVGRVGEVVGTFQMVHDGKWVEAPQVLQ